MRPWRIHIPRAPGYPWVISRWHDSHQVTTNNFGFEHFTSKFSICLVSAKVCRDRRWTWYCFVCNWRFYQVDQPSLTSRWFFLFLLDQRDCCRIVSISILSELQHLLHATTSHTLQHFQNNFIASEGRIQLIKTDLRKFGIEMIFSRAGERSTTMLRCI